jgi:glycosyltransferase involved in cell wall biosynthesis
LALKVPKDLRAGLVSIGLPVYNGGRYLRSALDSLITQHYENLEIIISDNASGDDTEAICREYAARDSRIRYYRVERNMGPAWNAVRVYEDARGEFFMWAAHDDLRHPQYLERCVAALNSNPRALVCCTGVKLIDEAGNDVSESFPFRSLPPTGATPRERLRALTRSSSWLHFYSLFRTTAIAHTKLGKHMWGADVVLVADVCLRGEVALVPEKLFDYRYFVTKTNQDLAHSISTGETRVEVSWSDLAAELIDSVWRSPLSFAERLRLAWMVPIEFCIRNQSVGWGIGREGFDGARRAFAGGNYGRTLTLGYIGLLKQTVNFVQRVKNSASSRGRKLKRELWPHGRSPEERRRG